MSVTPTQNPAGQVFNRHWLSDCRSDRRNSRHLRFFGSHLHIASRKSARQRNLLTHIHLLKKLTVNEKNMGIGKVAYFPLHLSHTERFIRLSYRLPPKSSS